MSRLNKRSIDLNDCSGILYRTFIFLCSGRIPDVPTSFICPFVTINFVHHAIDVIERVACIFVENWKGKGKLLMKINIFRIDTKSFNLILECRFFLFQEAAESIAFYRRVKATSKEVEIEIKKIYLQLNPRIDKILQNSNGNKTHKSMVYGISYGSKPLKDKVDIMMMRRCYTILQIYRCEQSQIFEVYKSSLFKTRVFTKSRN